MHRPLASSLFIVLATVHWQSSRAEDVQSGLFACAKLGDNLERVTCYDRLAVRVRAAMAAATTTPSNPSPAPGSVSAQEMFGARPVDVPAAAPERKELKSISAHVTALRDQKAGTILDLDNGQKWQQLGHEDLLIKVGERVTISRGAFSSFWIMSESNRSDHVKRLL